MLCDILCFMQLPIEFVNRMKEDLGKEAQAFFSSYDVQSEKALRVNLLKTDCGAFVSKNPWKLSDKDRVEWCAEGFCYKEESSTAPGKHPYHAAGVYYIQEPSAMVPVEKLDVKPQDRVLDLCASPGGKSTQILSKLKGKGLLVSNEPVPSRAKILSENIERMGASNALVISAYPQDISEGFEGYFNKILVDAPCSGEGMFRKNPEAMDEWSLESVQMCAERQRQILKEAVKMLSPGGRLVYSTCTFSKEEDEENVEWLVNEFPFLHLIGQEKLWPHRIKGEGHFVASFEKEGIVSDDCYPQRGLQSLTPMKKIPLLTDFLKEILEDSPEQVFPSDETAFLTFKDEIYSVPVNYPSVKGLKVLRTGLHLGTLKKNRFEPSHALALYLRPSQVRNSISLNESEAEEYLLGRTLMHDGPKGWYLVDIDGYSLGWGKLSDGILKNHYPKGLRIQK